MMWAFRAFLDRNENYHPRAPAHMFDEDLLA